MLNPLWAESMFVKLGGCSTKITVYLKRRSHCAEFALVKAHMRHSRRLRSVFESRGERRERALQPTRSLHQVFLLAVAVAADVMEGEEKVMLLMQLSRQLYLYLKARRETQNPGFVPSYRGSFVLENESEKGLWSISRED